MAGSASGATLQNYNNELVKCIEELRDKREEVNKQIANSEEEKAKIQNDLRILTERLAKINDNLTRKVTARDEYDKTIKETEQAYTKVNTSKTSFATKTTLNFFLPLPLLPPSRPAPLVPHELNDTCPSHHPPFPLYRLWRVHKRFCTC